MKKTLQEKRSQQQLKNSIKTKTMKHTKGPWKVVKRTIDNGGALYSINSKDWNIAGIWWNNEHEAEANAKLIASAPELKAKNAELLEACQMAQGGIMALLALSGQSADEQLENKMVKHLEQAIKNAT